MTTTESNSACRQRCFERFSTYASRSFSVSALLLSSVLMAGSALASEDAPVKQGLSHPQSDMDKMISSLMSRPSPPSALDRLISSLSDEPIQSELPSPTSPMGPSPAVMARKISEKYKIDPIQASTIVQMVHEESAQKNMDPVLVLSIIATESAFNPKARSSAGAMGLMQAMPVYHQDKLDRLGVSRQDLYNPRQNIRVGTEILSEYMRLSKGNTTSALQRYNGSLSDRSRRYSNKVFRAMTWLSSP